MTTARNINLLLSFAWVVVHVKCQFSDNTPPIMWLDRNWRIFEDEPANSVITRVHGSDNENDKLEYGLEASDGKNAKLPFTIDKEKGVVYLNESLKGRGGENLHLFVTVFDGKLTAKTEVWVNILNSSNSGSGSKGHQAHIHPPFLNLSPFNNRPPQSIANNPPPVPRPPGFQQKKTYPDPTQIPDRVHLLPVSPTSQDSQDSERSNKTEGKDGSAFTTQKANTSHSPDSENELVPLDQPVKSEPDLTITLVPVVSVCAIFLAVGIIALVFRKKICLGRTKGSKEDMRKESSGGIVLQEDPGLAMQHWRGPRAFSNRYEPWERETAHPQASSQLSSTSKCERDRWEFPRHRLKFFNILGEGAFGQVWKCEALELDGSEGGTVVGVKTLKENATEKERSDLISELQVMKMLEPHPNVVKLLGCCTEKDPIFLIMEFVSKGKLQSYLRNSRAERYYNNMHGQSKTLTSRDLTSFVYQVAKGMEFLSANGIIHRDLAARNVLITEEHTCKVADFGFARDVIASHVYERKSEGRLPIRWMAPESLYDNIFSVKSDVWSFGVLIWEVVTLGSTPYPGLSAAEVMRKVRDGHRLDKPEHCRRELYNIMYYCWDKDPKQRPTFTECVELLEKLLMTETDYIELERFPDHSYYNMMSLSGEKL